MAISKYLIQHILVNQIFTPNTDSSSSISPQCKVIKNSTNIHIFRDISSNQTN